MRTFLIAAMLVVIVSMPIPAMAQEQGLDEQVTETMRLMEALMNRAVENARKELPVFLDAINRELQKSIEELDKPAPEIKGQPI